MSSKVRCATVGFPGQVALLHRFVCSGTSQSLWNMPMRAALQEGPGPGGLRALGTSAPSTCPTGHPLAILSGLTLGWAVRSAQSQVSPVFLSPSLPHEDSTFSSVLLLFPLTPLWPKYSTLITVPQSPAHGFQSLILSVCRLVLFKFRECSGLEMKGKRLISMGLNVYFPPNCLELQTAVQSLITWLFLHLQEQRPTRPRGLPWGAWALWHPHQS